MSKKKQTKKEEPKHKKEQEEANKNENEKDFGGFPDDADFRKGLGCGG